MVNIECVLDAKAGIGEGPVWCDQQKLLWWVEILEQKLHCFDPATQQDKVWNMPSYIGCIALRKDGGIIVALQDGFASFDINTGDIKYLNEYAPRKNNARFNDGVVSKDGRFLATTMADAPPFDAPIHSLVMLDKNAGVKTLENDLNIGNGLAFSNDGKTLYLSDSHPSRSVIWKYDWDMDDGIATNKQVFFDAATTPGHPDGAAIDTDDCYWTACAYGWQIMRITPDGKIDKTIPVPLQKPTKIAFGGERLDIMYLTSIGTNLEEGSGERQPNAGGIIAIEAGYQGTPTAKYN